MGLGSFGFLRIWGLAEVRREDGDVGKRLGMWENMVVIGMVWGRRIWSNRGGFRRTGPHGGPRTTVLSQLSLTLPRNCREEASTMWGKPFRSLGLGIFWSVVML
jgi:hypothetical protein